LQNDPALHHAVAMKLKHPRKAAPIDECGEAQAYRLRCGKIVHRFLPVSIAESGFTRNSHPNASQSARLSPAGSIWQNADNG